MPSLFSPWSLAKLRHLTTATLVSFTLISGAVTLSSAQAGIVPRLPNLEAPGNRESGGTRNASCLISETDDEQLRLADQLVAVVPTSNIGLTTQAYPTFFVYIPPTTAKAAKFVLYDEATDELIYEAQFALNNESGFVAIELPNNGIQQPLVSGKRYYWYFAMMCNGETPDLVTEGSIQRTDVDDTLAAAIHTATPKTLPQVYAEAGIWYDMLAALMTEMPVQGGSTPLSQDWQDILQFVGLEELSSAPMLASMPIY